jgi:hypothetical protein
VTAVVSPPPTPTDWYQAAKALIVDSARFRTYSKQGWPAFQAFCALEGRPTDASADHRVNDATLMAFVAFTHQRAKVRGGGTVSVATIDAYVSAIKFMWRVQLGRHAVSPGSLAGLVLAAARARSTRPARPMAPMTAAVFDALLALDCPIWVYAPTLIAFYFLLRASEMGESAHDSASVDWQRKVLRMASVSISAPSVPLTAALVQLTLIWRKYAETGYAVHLRCTAHPFDASLCPVRVLRAYLAWRATVAAPPAPDLDHGTPPPDPPGPPSGPGSQWLFVEPNGRPLRRTTTSDWLKAAGERAGLLPANLASHSIRIAGTTTLLTLGADLPPVQRRGGWKSAEAMMTYWRTVFDVDPRFQPMLAMVGIAAASAGRRPQTQSIAKASAAGRSKRAPASDSE